MFKNEEGFSLLELVVAVGVAGIIAAVALPTFAGLQDKASTNSSVYAASASAAEALANSTMGSTGSASIQPVVTTATVSADDFLPNANWGWLTQVRINAWVTKEHIINTLPGGFSTTNWGDIYDWNNPTPVEETGIVTIDFITQAKAEEIAAAINNGATTVTVDGVTHTIASSKFVQQAYNPDAGNYTMTVYDAKVRAAANPYGSWSVRINTTTSSFSQDEQGNWIGSWGVATSVTVN